MKFKTKAKHTRVRLPVPAPCDLPYFNPDMGYATLACHKALPCRRCGLCLHHCLCAGQADKPAGNELKAEQLVLCDKPTFKR